MRNIHCSRSHQTCKEAHKWKCSPRITTDLYYSSVKLCFILASFSVFTSKVNLLKWNSSWISLLTLHTHKCFSTLYSCFTLCECYSSLIGSPKVRFTRHVLQQIKQLLQQFQLLSAGLLVSYSQSLDFGTTRGWWASNWLFTATPTFFFHTYSGCVAIYIIF